MQNVLDENGNHIGYFNGTTVFGNNEIILYRVLDSEIVHCLHWLVNLKEILASPWKMKFYSISHANFSHNC